MPDGRPAESASFNPRTRPVVPPIHHSVTYFLDDESYKDVQAGGLDEIWYGRFRNPTVDVTAAAIARLEGTEAAFMTSSGMGAIATTLLTLLSAGDRIVAANQVYGDTRDLLVRDLPDWGIDVVPVDAVDLDAWSHEGAVRGDAGEPSARAGRSAGVGGSRPRPRRPARRRQHVRHAVHGPAVRPRR
jgi:cystathionine beta-lyase/cystathionine gamma-synthase